jgi:hypothetical protein
MPRAGGEPRPQSGALPDVFYGEGVVVASSCVPAETQALKGVPCVPGTCFLLSDAHAAFADLVEPLASFAIAVTHLLKGVPGVPATWSLLSALQKNP